MSSEEIKNYIKQQLKAGASRKTIEKSLQSAGWTPENIQNAFTSFDAPEKIEENIQVNENETGEQDKIRNKTTSFVIVLIGIIVLGGVAFQQYLEIKGNEIKTPEVKELMIPTAEEDQGVKELPSVSETRIVEVSFAGTLKDKIFFINSKGEIISEVRVELIKFSGKFFENYVGGDESQILIHNEAIETADGYFYFFLAIPEICGNKNCLWLLFKFNNNNQQLSYIGSAEEEGDADIFGRIQFGGYYFSPDKKKVTVMSNGWGGSCYQSDDIDILTFEKSNFQNVGNEYINKDYTIHEINSLNWIDEDCFTFSSVESRCEDKKSLSKEVKYCVSTNKTEILK